MKVIVYIMMLVSACLFVSCDRADNEPSARPVSVRIESVNATAESISFEIVHENAVSVSYGYAKSSEEVSEYKSREVSGDEKVKVLLEDLSAECEYEVSAFAVNADGMRSESVFVTVVTSSLPAVSVEIIEHGSDNVVFRLKGVNAANYRYAVLPAENAETGELTEQAEVSDNKEYEVDGLESGRRYAVVAQAFNAAGDGSERAYAPFETELAPVVSFVSEEIEDRCAVFSYTSGNSAFVSYALALKTDNQPTSFVTVDYSSDKVYFYGLEPSTDYRLWFYGINDNDYAGDVAYLEFRTEASPDPRRSVSISEITSFDAKVEIKWDDTLYDGGYWIVGTPETIGKPVYFDWQKSLDLWLLQRFEYQGFYNMSNFQITPGETYRLGFVFVDKEGNLDIETAIWRDVELDKIEFGDSECSVSIEGAVTAYSTVTFSVVNNGADAYYLGYQMGDVDVEDFAKQTIRTERRTDFDKEVKFEYLQSESVYTFVAIPVDANGIYGEVEVLQVETGPVAETSDCRLSLELKNQGYTGLHYDLVLENGAVDAVYTIYRTGDEGFGSEEEIMQKLGYGNRSYGASLLKLDYLKSGTEYNIVAAPLDRYGRMGKIVRLSNCTKEIVFDGTGEVSLSYDGSSSTISFEMGRGVAGYYYQLMSKYTLDAITDQQFVENIMSSGMEMIKENTAVKNEDVFYTHIVVLPVDENGKLCPLIKREISSL